MTCLGGQFGRNCLPISKFSKITRVIYCQNFTNRTWWLVVNNTKTKDCDSHSPALLDLFLSSDASICSTMAFPPLRNSDHVDVSVSMDFPNNSQQDASFHRIAYDYSLADWDRFHDYLRDVPW